MISWLFISYRNGLVVILNDQKRVKASSYMEYAPSLVQFVDESQYSIHIDFEIYDRWVGSCGPRLEYGDRREHLPSWITYY